MAACSASAERRRKSTKKHRESTTRKAERPHRHPPHARGRLWRSRQTPPRDSRPASRARRRRSRRQRRWWPRRRPGRPPRDTDRVMYGSKANIRHATLSVLCMVRRRTKNTRRRCFTKTEFGRGDAKAVKTAKRFGGQASPLYNEGRGQPSKGATQSKAVKRQGTAVNGSGNRQWQAVKQAVAGLENTSTWLDLWPAFSPGGEVGPPPFSCQRASSIVQRVAEAEEETGDRSHADKRPKTLTCMGLRHSLQAAPWRASIAARRPSLPQPKVIRAVVDV